MEVNLLNPDRPDVHVRFVMMREDGTNAGKYSKDGSWSEKTIEAFHKFVEAAEEDVLGEIFEEDGEEVGEEAEGKETYPAPPPAEVPTLGGKKGIPQI